jgi:hypothetical protein
MSIYPDRKNGKLTGRWRVEVQLAGQRARGCFDTLDEARTKEKEWLNALRTGAPISGAKVRKRLDSRGVPATLGALIQKAMGSLWHGRRTEHTAFQRLHKTARMIGLDTPLENLTTERMDILASRLAPAAPATRNRHYSGLLVLLKWGKARGYVVDLPAFSWEEEDNGRMRWITPAEEDRLVSLLEDFGRGDIAGLVTR